MVTSGHTSTPLNSLDSPCRFYCCRDLSPIITIFILCHGVSDCNDNYMLSTMLGNILGCGTSLFMFFLRMVIRFFVWSGTAPRCLNFSYVTTSVVKLSRFSWPQRKSLRSRGPVLGAFMSEVLRAGRTSVFNLSVRCGRVSSLDSAHHHRGLSSLHPSFAKRVRYQGSSRFLQ